MKKGITTLLVISLTTLVSCSQSNNEQKTHNQIVLQNTKGIGWNCPDDISQKKTKKYQTEHQFGGWYCPDNLNGFPAVDIKDWDKVPVVNGRLPTKEETQNGTSLIYFDPSQFPDAKPLDMKMPKLARFYNENTKKSELIIVIEAISARNDTVAGFRYLNGGNGSSRLHKIDFLSDEEIEKLYPASFVALDIKINSSREKIWEVMTDKSYAKTLQLIFDKENNLPLNWEKDSKVNFKYFKKGVTTSEFAQELFGSLYIQIDYDFTVFQHVEKFLLLEDQHKKYTELKIVCGPYGDDFEEQKVILNKWANKVKELSEIGFIFKNPTEGIEKQKNIKNQKGDC